MRLEPLIGVEPVMQPSPARNQGGDCFACSALAVIRHFWPDESADLTIDNAVAWWAQENGVVANIWEMTDRTLKPHREGRPFPLRIHKDPFLPKDWLGPQYDPVWEPAAFNERTEAYLAAGWIGLASIRFEPRMYGMSDVIEDRAPRRWRHAHDHMVLYDGRRERHDEDRGYIQEMHVVCSVKGGYWIDTADLLDLHGGMGIWWLRPTGRDQ